MALYKKEVHGPSYFAWLNCHSTGNFKVEIKWWKLNLELNFNTLKISIWSLKIPLQSCFCKKSPRSPPNSGTAFSMLFKAPQPKNIEFWKSLYCYMAHSLQILFSPVCPVYSIIDRIRSIPRSCVFLKKSQVSPGQVASGACILDRSSLIFSNFWNGALAGPDQRVVVVLAYCVASRLFQYFVKLTQFSRNFRPAFVSVVWPGLCVSREVIAEERSHGRKLLWRSPLGPSGRGGRRSGCAAQLFV